VPGHHVARQRREDGHSDIEVRLVAVAAELRPKLGHVPERYCVELESVAGVDPRSVEFATKLVLGPQAGIWPRRTSPCREPLRSQASWPFAITSDTRLSGVVPPSPGALANPTCKVEPQPAEKAKARIESRVRSMVSRSSRPESAAVLPSASHINVRLKYVVGRERHAFAGNEAIAWDGSVRAWARRG